MQCKGFVLELMAKDVSDTIDFYTGMLGFELLKQEKEKCKLLNHPY